MTPKHSIPSPARRRRLVFTAVLTVIAGTSFQAYRALAGPASETSFQITDRKIQKAPTTFKFQSRISQAKMPVGDQLFTKIIVNLVRANTEVLCREEIRDVVVRDSVLNMEIGRGFQCPLDDIIAQNADLSFQICLDRDENCLSPIPLSSVPYAVKSSFSHQAEQAYKADVAAQAHYAHRVTADTGLLEGAHYDRQNGGSLGTGYYDFQTPVTGGAAPLTRVGSLADPATAEAGGYIQWTPMDVADDTLHICTRETDINGVQTLTDLTSLEVHAQTLLAHKNLVVRDRASIGGSESRPEHLSVYGDTWVQGNATAGMDLTVGRYATVTETTTTKDIVATNAATVGNGLTVTSGSTTLSGTLKAGQVNGAAALEVDGSGEIWFRGKTHFDDDDPPDIALDPSSIDWSKAALPIMVFPQAKVPVPAGKTLCFLTGFEGAGATLCATTEESGTKYLEAQAGVCTFVCL